MNDEELDPVNGYPIRIVLPGYSGAKNIKWLKEINISKEVCDVPWQTGVAYKSFGPEIKSFLDKYFEKILYPIRSRVPALRIGMAGIDLSPLILIFGINILQPYILRVVC